MDEEELIAALEVAFGGSQAERRAVARAARDLASAEQYVTDRATTLTASQIIEELSDAPEGGPADRWNWWMGALEIAYCGYATYQVRRWSEATDDDDPDR